MANFMKRAEDLSSEIPVLQSAHCFGCGTTGRMGMPQGSPTKDKVLRIHSIDGYASRTRVLKTCAATAFGCNI